MSLFFFEDQAYVRVQLEDGVTGRNKTESLVCCAARLQSLDKKSQFVL